MRLTDDEAVLVVSVVAPQMIAYGRYTAVGTDDAGTVGFVVRRSRAGPALFRVRVGFPGRDGPDGWTEVRYVLDADGRGRAVYQAVGGAAAVRTPRRRRGGRRGGRPGGGRGRMRGHGC